jgi:hypothetical protein
LPLGTWLGEFEITGLVGEGGFGIVYLARDHVLERDVAVKEYIPSALAARTEAATVVVRAARFEEAFQAGLRSFINEARLLARFDHPSLVKVHRFWSASGTAYMVMPFYEGITLKVMLKNLGRRPDEVWLKDLLRPLTDALELLHNDHCFHRDIAPDNILMLEGQPPVLLDFGAARRVIGDLTHELTAILKPGYAPIEQYAEVSSMKQGAWTDIYALASVVYFAIEGRAPEPSVARLLSDPMVPLAAAAAGRYSDEFLRGIDKALSVKPQDRPQSIAELRTLIGLGDRRRSVSSPMPGVAVAPAKKIAASAQVVPATIRHDSGHQAQPSAVSAAVLDETSVRIERKTAKGALVVFGGLLLLVIGAAAYFLLGPRTEAPTAVERKSASPAAPDTQGGPSAVADRPAPSTTVVATPPFTPELMLRQVLEGRDAMHEVIAMTDQTQVRIGQDALRFSITSSKPGYLYVLALGTRDSDFDLLFPNARDANNHLDAGQVRRLPGAKWSLPASGPAGTNQFVAIVSDEPRDFGRLGTQPEGAFRRFSLEAGARLFRDYTGKAPLYAGDVRCKRAGNCSQSYGAATFSIEEVDPGVAQADPSEAALTQASKPKPAPGHVKPTPANASANPSTKIGNKPECVDILQRASLGEALSSAERITLKEDCR